MGEVVSEKLCKVSTWFFDIETVHLIFQLITCNFVRQADPTAHLALSLANRAAVLVKLKFFKEATQENMLRHLANFFLQQVN